MLLLSVISLSFNVYTLYRDDDSHVLSMCKLRNTRPVIQSLTASAISHLILLMQLNSGATLPHLNIQLNTVSDACTIAEFITFRIPSPC